MYFKWKKKKKNLSQIILFNLISFITRIHIHNLAHPLIS